MLGPPPPVIRSPETSVIVELPDCQHSHGNGTDLRRSDIDLGEGCELEVLARCIIDGFDSLY